MVRMILSVGMIGTFLLALAGCTSSSREMKPDQPQMQASHPHTMQPPLEY